MRKVENILKCSSLLQKTGDLKQKIDELDAFIADTVADNQFDVPKEVALVQEIRNLLSEITVSYIEATPQIENSETLRVRGDCGFLSRTA